MQNMCVFVAVHLEDVVPLQEYLCKDACLIE